MPILRYIHVSKQFTPESYGVMNINFEVEPGELVVITGHTGSGKTTLMKLLTREYSVSEGELYFKDTPVHALKSNKVHLHRRQIGVVYQDYRLIKDLTVWENVALPLYISGKKEDEIEQRTSDLLNLIKLTDKYDMFPSQLSGGEAQRVSIARSLALAPELIFADEPTGNLDADTSKTIAMLLAKINELGTTVLLSTHDLTLLDIFTNERHVQLEKGAIVKDSGSATKPEPTVATSMGIPINVADHQDDSKRDDSSKTDTATTSSENDGEPSNSTKASDSAEPSNSTESSAVPVKKSFWHKLKLSVARSKPSKTQAPPASTSATDEKSTLADEARHDSKPEPEPELQTKPEPESKQELETDDEPKIEIKREIELDSKDEQDSAKPISVKTAHQAKKQHTAKEHHKKD